MSRRKIVRLTTLILVILLAANFSVWVNKKTKSAVRIVTSSPLSFYLVADSAKPSSLKIKTADGKEELSLEPTPSITIDDIESAKVESIQWPPEFIEAFRQKGVTPPPFKILIKCTPQGRAKLFKITSENLGKTLAIVAGDKVLASPKIFEAVPGGELSIQGNISAKEALLLAQEINDRKAVQGEERIKNPK